MWAWPAKLFNGQCVYSCDPLWNGPRMFNSVSQDSVLQVWCPDHPLSSQFCCYEHRYPSYSKAPMDAIKCFSVWKSVIGKNLPLLWQCAASSSWHASSNILYIWGTYVNAYLLTMFSITLHSHLMPSHLPVHGVTSCLSRRRNVLAEGASQCRYCHNRHSALLPPKDHNLKKENHIRTLLYIRHFTVFEPRNMPTPEKWCSVFQQHPYTWHLN